jgi:peptide/nickel transport system ATP-binding protein
LVGESGSGKTTLGRSIIQLISSTDGEVRYRGSIVNQLSPAKLVEFRKKFQIVFQDPFSSLNPRIPIGKAIMEPMKVHGIGSSDKKRRDLLSDLLVKVNLLPEHQSRFPHQFSGGQRQRIVIARALALDPEFLICDESVSSLDVSIQAEILNLLNDLKRKMDLTYIFISHDLSVVKYMSDRVLVIKDGKMVELEEADKLYSNPRSGYTRQLIDSIPGGVPK